MKQTFGPHIRKLRKDEGISLRKFAELLGISPTCLSRLENEKVDPPSQDLVLRMATQLGEDPYELLAMARKIHPELPEIIQSEPREMSLLLRAAKNLSVKELQELRKKAERMKVGTKT